MGEHVHASGASATPLTKASQPDSMRIVLVHFGVPERDRRHKGGSQAAESTECRVKWFNGIRRALVVFGLVASFAVGCGDEAADDDRGSADVSVQPRFDARVSVVGGGASGFDASVPVVGGGAPPAVESDAGGPDAMPPMGGSSGSPPDIGVGGEPDAAGPPPAGCGDGALDGNEECDDGNAVGGDGCSRACDVESVDVSAGGIFAGSFEAGSFDRFTFSLAVATVALLETGDEGAGCPGDTVATLTLAGAAPPEIAAADDGGVGACSRVLLRLDPGAYTLVVRMADGSGLDAYVLTASFEPLGGPACADDEAEENDTFQTAALVVPGAFEAMACEADVDYYAFDAAVGCEIAVVLTFSHADGDIDLRLQAPDGSTVASGLSGDDNEIAGYTVGPGGAGRYVARVNSVRASNAYGFVLAVDCGAAGGDDGIRLVGGPNARSGRVEVQIDGVWGTVCDDGWNLALDGEDRVWRNADVACRQLGYPGAEDVDLDVDRGEDPIWLDDVICEGDERRLADCPAREPVGTTNCVHTEDVGLVCLAPGTCREGARCVDGTYCADGECVAIAEGAIRLADGDGPNHGRVEIFFDGVWGTVCDDGWNPIIDGEDRARRNGEVVCRQLGLAGLAELDDAVPEGEEPTWLDDVECEGNEARLADCPAAPRGDENCGHFEDVGIRCLDG